MYKILTKYIMYTLRLCLVLKSEEIRIERRETLVKIIM